MPDDDMAASPNGAARIIKLLSQNRGIFSDILVFLANLFLMRLLTRDFIKLVSRSDSDDDAAKLAVFLFCLGIFILPPVAAILKRYRFHERLKLRKQTVGDDKDDLTFGCLFNPIFYFCLSIVIVCAINAFLSGLIFGGKEPGAALFISTTFGGLGFAIVQTYLVYRFFKAPTKEPKWKFLDDPRAEFLGDLCAFVNIILFQVIWNTLLGTMGNSAVSNFTEFVGRIFILCFLALLLYFPPRIFFLAEDIKKPAAWASILLANSPIIVRFLIGGF